MTGAFWWRIGLGTTVSSPDQILLASLAEFQVTLAPSNSKIIFSVKDTNGLQMTIELGTTSGWQYVVIGQ